MSLTSFLTGILFNWVMDNFLMAFSSGSFSVLSRSLTSRSFVFGFPASYWLPLLHLVIKERIETAKAKKSGSFSNIQ
jgi:hypothetical protein